MIKDALDDDPEAALRRRLTDQFTGEPAMDPVVDSPVAPQPKTEAPAPPTMPVTTMSRDIPDEPRPPPTPPPPAPAPPPPTTPTPPVDQPAPSPAPSPQPAPAPAPQLPPNTSASDLDASKIRKIFAMQGKQATDADIAYWKAALQRANGDWGYIQMRMLQPDTPQTGSAPTAGMTYQQALQYVQSRIGRTLTPAEINAAFQKFGGSPTDTFTSQGLDPVVASFGGGMTDIGRGVPLPPGPTGQGPRIDNGPDDRQNPNGMPQGLWGADFMAQVRQMLLQRLQSASGPVGDDDPAITAAMTAARNEGSRASDKERTELAEHLYAGGGLNTDAITQQIQQSGERNATGLSTLRANLMQREMEGRRSELQNLMQLALQSGDAEMTNAIRLQLAALDAQLRREGYGVDMAKYEAYLNSLTGRTLIGAQ